MDNNFQQIALLIPIFGIFIILEALIFIQNSKTYNYEEASSNIASGIIPILTGIFLKSVTILPYIYIYNNYRLFEINKSNFLISYFLLYLLIDKIVLLV